MREGEKGVTGGERRRGKEEGEREEVMAEGGGGKIYDLIEEGGLDKGMNENGDEGESGSGGENGSESEGEGEDGCWTYSFQPDALEPMKTYSMRVQWECKGTLSPTTTTTIQAKPLKSSKSDWGEEGVFVAPKMCVWKECPEGVAWGRRYYTTAGQKVARRVGREIDEWCTVVGATPLPLGEDAGTATAWGVKVVESSGGCAGAMSIGVAPFDIDQNADRNFEKCGWYFCCFGSVLCSGPPHNYRDKKYGPRRDYGEYVHTGDTVGVVMDTAKGELSFVLKGVNLGVAYKGIPLDKPLVPCAILRFEDDAVEIIF